MEIILTVYRTHRRIFNSAILVYYLLYRLNQWLIYDKAHYLQSNSEKSITINGQQNNEFTNWNPSKKITTSVRGMNRLYRSGSSLIATLRVDCKMSANCRRLETANASSPSTGRALEASSIAVFTFNIQTCTIPSNIGIWIGNSMGIFRKKIKASTCPLVQDYFDLFHTKSI